MIFSLTNKWLNEPFNTFQQQIIEKENSLTKTTDTIKRFFLYKDLAEDRLIEILFQNSDAIAVFDDFFYGTHSLITKVDHDTFLHTFKKYVNYVYDPSEFSEPMDLYYSAGRLMKDILNEFLD